MESHRKAAAARADGKLRDEIVPVAGVAEDGCIRPDTSAEKLATLKPAFRVDGTRHRRHLQPADRRRRRGAGLHRGVCAKRAGCGRWRG